MVGRVASNFTTRTQIGIFESSLSVYFSRRLDKVYVYYI